MQDQDLERDLEALVSERNEIREKDKELTEKIKQTKEQITKKRKEKEDDIKPGDPGYKKYRDILKENKRLVGLMSIYLAWEEGKSLKKISEILEVPEYRVQIGFQMEQRYLSHRIITQLQNDHEDT